MENEECFFSYSLFDEFWLSFWYAFIFGYRSVFQFNPAEVVVSATVTTQGCWWKSKLCQVSCITSIRTTSQKTPLWILFIFFVIDILTRVLSFWSNDFESAIKEQHKFLHPHRTRINNCTDSELIHLQTTDKDTESCLHITELVGLSLNPCPVSSFGLAALPFFTSLTGVDNTLWIYLRIWSWIFYALHYK